MEELESKEEAETAGGGGVGRPEGCWQQRQGSWKEATQKTNQGAQRPEGAPPRTPPLRRRMQQEREAAMGQ